VNRKKIGIYTKGCLFGFLLKWEVLGDIIFTMKGDMKNILIVGGAGFIGNNLARKLVNEGNKVFVFDDFSTGLMSNLLDMEKKVKIKRGDVRSFKDVEEFVLESNPDIVYHLAALHFIPDCNKEPEKAHAINVDGPRNILHAISKLSKKPRFVLVSTSSVYKPSDEKIKESDPVGPFEIYGKTKLEGEKVTQEECEKHNIDYFIVRPFSVYGPFNGVPQVIPEIISQLKNGNNEISLGNLEPRRDFIHVKDVAEALSLFINKGRSGEIYNFGNNTSNSIREITEIIKELLKSSGREIEFKSKRERFRGDLERKSLVGDDRKVQKDLDWLPSFNLREGIKLTLKEEGLI